MIAIANFLNNKYAIFTQELFSNQIANNLTQSQNPLISTTD